MNDERRTKETMQVYKFVITDAFRSVFEVVFQAQRREAYMAQNPEVDSQEGIPGRRHSSTKP